MNKAMHMMKGSWRYLKSAKQAIEEENIFREDLARMQGKPPQLCFRKSGVMISEIEKAGGGACISAPVPDMDWPAAIGINEYEAQAGVEASLPSRLEANPGKARKAVVAAVLEEK